MFHTFADVYNCGMVQYTLGWVILGDRKSTLWSNWKNPSGSKKRHLHICLNLFAAEYPKSTKSTVSNFKQSCALASRLALTRHWHKGKNWHVTGCREFSFLMTRYRVTRQKYVWKIPYILRVCRDPFLPLPPLVSHLSYPISCLPYSSPPCPLYPSSLETRMGSGEVGHQQGWRMTATVGGERGEFESQKGWRMTAGQRGVNVPTRRSGGWLLGGEV